MCGNSTIQALAEKYCLGNYGPRDVALVKGQGSYVWDADGKRYLDCFGGIAVAATGHCHPKVVEAIQQQAETLIHVSNLYLIEPQARLAEFLCKNTFAGKAFFANSGTEVAETSLKLARKYARKKGQTGRSCFITMQRSFHGRTYGATSATGQDTYHKDYDPLLPGFAYVPLNDLEAVKQAVTDSTCAILVEPVQGEGGIHVAQTEFLKGLRGLCDDKEMLLIYDEVQCGNGRTGKLYDYMHSGVVPDVLFTAKGLGSGVPIGAMLVSEKCSDVFEPGSHGTTFGGNPLATAAALATMKVVEEENLCQRSAQLGQKAMEFLQKMKETRPGIVEVRGRGLMIGVELEQPAKPVVKEMMKRGILIGSAGAQVLRLLPPLTIDESDWLGALETLQEVLSQ
jgi:acetylornithine aminotransferase/acetylornithine/N-succinyldiaminopimelate aminotransferase